MKPEFVKIGNKNYKINTDFRVGIECDKIARDKKIGDYERVLAIIYKLFGDEGLNDKGSHANLLELALKYLSRGEEQQGGNDTEPNMDFNEDMSYIYASFMSEYQIDLEKTHLHLWTFFDLLNGLSEDCVLNRIRYIRDFDVNEIENPKERKRILELKESVSLTKEEKKLTDKEKDTVNKFMKLAQLE